ncbi:hypothetical protein C8R45DRAFT_1166767 [Mycena sanguinolenta]|nr:hypothetical protein C8R45DRAFT_1166767 [Mycena sanguinolenta]
MSLSRLLDPVRRPKTSVSPHETTHGLINATIERLEALSSSSTRSSDVAVAPTPTNIDRAVKTWVENTQLVAWVTAQLGGGTWPFCNTNPNVSETVQLRDWVTAQLGGGPWSFHNANREDDGTLMANGSTAAAEKENAFRSRASRQLAAEVLSPQARDALTALSENNLHDGEVDSDVILALLNAGPQPQPQAAWDFDWAIRPAAMLAEETWDPMGCELELESRDVHGVQDATGAGDVGDSWMLDVMSASSEILDAEGPWVDYILSQHREWQSDDESVDDVWADAMDDSNSGRIQDVSEPLPQPPVIAAPNRQVELLQAAFAATVSAARALNDSGAPAQFHFRPEPRAVEEVQVATHDPVVPHSEQAVESPYGDIGDGRPSSSTVLPSRSARAEIGGPGQSSGWNMWTSFPDLDTLRSKFQRDGAEKLCAAEESPEASEDSEENLDSSDEGSSEVELEGAESDICEEDSETGSVYIRMSC